MGPAPRSDRPCGLESRQVRAAEPQLVAIDGQVVLAEAGGLAGPPRRGGGDERRAGDGERASELRVVDIDEVAPRGQVLARREVERRGYLGQDKSARLGVALQVLLHVAGEVIRQRLVQPRDLFGGRGALAV